MANPLIQVEQLSKLYRIRPSIGMGWRQNRSVLVDDIIRMAGRLRGKPGREKKVNFWALKDVSLEAGPGDVLGVIGRNGAGKSTLLKVLSRVTEPTSGRAVIYGRVGSLLEVGTGFHSELSGRENIFISGAILGMSRAEVRKKFDEIVAFSGVEDFLETPVKRFSSGMEVRLAFSVAAHLNPQVLLIDEILSVGDALFRDKSLQKIKEVSNNGGTILFVSHNMTTVASLCNKALVLEHGNVIFPVGPVSSGIDLYLSRVRESSLKDLYTGRKGARPQGIEIKNFGVYDEAGMLLETLSSGMSVDFVLDYHRWDISLEKPVDFEILIKTLNGEVIARLNNRVQTLDVENGNSFGRVTCRVEKLPLASGTICISLAIFQDQQVLDKIEDVFIGKVELGGHQSDVRKAGSDAWVVLDGVWRHSAGRK